MRSRWTTVAVVAGGLALTACSSTSHPAASSAVTSPPRTSSPPATSAPTSSSTGSAGSSAGSTVCTAAELAGSVSGEQGGAGTIEVTVALRDSGTTPCTMDGYPAVLLVGSGGAQLPTNELQGGSLSFENVAPSSVALSPGQSAYFNLGFSDVPTGGETGCPTTTGLDVTAPGATPVSVPLQIQPCGGTVNVSAVFAAGSPATSTTAPSSAG